MGSGDGNVEGPVMCHAVRLAMQGEAGAGGTGFVRRAQK